MGAQDSNLTAAGYDLVCAVSQDAVNVTLMEYLAPDRAAFTACYVRDGQGNAVLTPVDQIVAKIGGDPFTQGDGAAGPLRDMGFLFGFKAKLGVPKRSPGSKPPPIIVLDQPGSAVTHQLYFAEFTLIFPTVVYKVDPDNWFGPESIPHLITVTQDPTAPLIFSTTTNLNVRDADFATLPQATQDAITGANPNTMFGVKQLVLDFAGAPAPGMADLGNCAWNQPIAWQDGYGELSFALPRCVADQYYQRLPAEAAVVSYGVHATTPQASSSIVPADIAFQVSPGLTADSAPTLDYLVTTGSSMPASAPFAWDWLEKSDEANFNGVMAIKLETFRNYLRQVATAASSTLSMAPRLGGDNSPSVVSSSAPLQWTDVQLKEGAIYPCLGTYQRQSLANNGDFISVSMDYHMSALLAFEGAKLHLQLSCTTTWNADLRSPQHSSYEKNVGGKFIDYVVNVDYVFGVTDGGKLTVAIGQPVVTDSSEDIAGQFQNVNFPFPAGAGLASTISAAKGDFDNTVQSAMQKFETALANGLGGIGSWIFPGDKTFTFKDAAFSDSGDLVVRLTYVAPN